MIGLFLGENNLPIEILRSLKKKKLKYFIIDLSKDNKFNAVVFDDCRRCNLNFIFILRYGLI